MNHVWISLGFWDNVWDYFGIILGSFGDNFGIMLVSFWERPEMVVVCVVLLVFVLEDCSCDVQDGRCCMACGECSLVSGV